MEIQGLLSGGKDGQDLGRIQLSSRKLGFIGRGRSTHREGGKETRRKEKAAIGGPHLVRADRDLAQQKEVSDHWKAGTDTIWVNQTRLACLKENRRKSAPPEDPGN